MIRIATTTAIIAAVLSLAACEANTGATASQGPSAASTELLNLGSSLLNRPAPVTTNCVRTSPMVSVSIILIMSPGGRGINPDAAEPTTNRSVVHYASIIAFDPEAKQSGKLVLRFLSAG